MTKKGEKLLGKEDILRSVQPLAPEAAPISNRLADEVRAAGWKYWARVLLGLVFVCFFAAWVPNAYLQYEYRHVFSESPCNLCLELNNQTQGCFIGNASNNVVPGTSWLTIHSINELGKKARWLRLPCDVCGDLNKGSIQQCLNRTFAPVQNDLNKKINLSLVDLNP